MTPDHTPPRKVRVADPLWNAYESVCKRVFGRTRSEDLVEHMRDVVRDHGTKAELALLAQADQERAEREARRQAGRPPKS